MSDVLNYYLQKYGVIENKNEDIKVDTNEKARERWQLLRKSMANISEVIEKKDVGDSKISHGIQYLRRISHVNDIEQALYIPKIDSYFTLDGCSIRIFDSNGRYKNFMAYSDIRVTFKRLEYSTSSDRFIAWSPKLNELYMLNSAFEVIENVDPNLADCPVEELFYNEDKNEIISFHSSKIIIWQFRYANKHLLPRTTVVINRTDKCSPVFTIERTQSKYQRLFFVNDCGVSVLDMFKNSVTCEYLSLHERPITALTFFNPLKLLVTGCKDGSIKVWSFIDNEIKLDMVFVGHVSCVNSLAIFPGGCQATIASCGNDKTLRVWSLELSDEIECIQLEYSSKLIGSDITKLTFFTLGSNFIDIWQQNQVIDELMTLSDPVSYMEFIEEIEPKILIRSKNNLIFYTEPTKNPEIITKTIVKDKKLKILSAVNYEENNCLLVLMQENRILQYNTKTHPMMLTSSAQYSSDDILLLLTVYKPIGDLNMKSTNKSLILTGSQLGWIMVHDTNQVENIIFRIEAHTNAPVNCMYTDSSNSRLFTSGNDNTIKVWHVYPFAIEPLSKVLSFFCGHMSTHLVAINNYLFTIFQDLEGAQYPSVVYNIQTRGRYDHSPNDDHIEPVNSVSACKRMKLFLSCSAGTENILKIWTRKNVLLRQIEVHFPIHHAVFSSPRGDIFAAIGHQICHIDNAKYLPKIYIKKQVVMHFESSSIEKNSLIEFDRDLFQKKFDLDDRDKMLSIKPVFKYQNYVDILTKEEADELSEAYEIRKKNLDKLKAVEDDIIKIKLGEYEKPKRKYENFIPKTSKADVFNFYFSQIVKYNKISMPTEEDISLVKNMKISHLDKYIKSEKEGFFPARETISKLTAPNNIRKGGFIPNSTILEALWPPKLLKEKADVWKPVLLSSLDLHRQVLAKQSFADVLEEEDSRFFDWESEEESEKVEHITPVEETVLDEIPSDILSKYESLIEEKQSIVDEIRDEFISKSDKTSETPKTPDTPKTTPRPVTTKLKKTDLKLPAISRIPATMPEIRHVRFSSPISNDPVSEKIQPTSNSVTEEKSQSSDSIFLTQVLDQEPVKKEKVSVLPNFLISFQNESWFQKICPPPHFENECLKLLPVPLTPSNFLSHVLMIMKSINDIDETLYMVNALNYLYSNESIEGRYTSKIGLMMESKLNSLDKLDSESKVLLFKSCLHLLASLEGYFDKSLVNICLVRFFDADDELKTFLKSILIHVGLEDETNTVEAEIFSFKLFSVRSGPGRIEDLNKLVYDWLEKLYLSMVSFSSECRDTISKEIHLIGSSHEKLSKSMILCLENVKSIFHCQILSPTDLILLYPMDKNPKSILTYINCLNFFRFKKLQKKQKEKSIAMDSMTEPIGPKKTIVSLPKLSPNKQCLVRIGESNADVLETKFRKDLMNLSTIYQKNVIVDHTQHPSMQPFHHYQVALGGGFVPFLHLHLKPCLVNPFPVPEDYIEIEHANPRSLSKIYHRAFIPQFSLPPEPF